jgi:phosphatidate cytidylyltransferase
MIILAYFLTGGIAFYVIGKKKTREEARHNRIKFFAYFVIINGVFLSIVIQPVVFRILAGIIVVTGFYELVTLFRNSGYLKKRFFLLSLCSYCLLSAGFICFSNLERNWILFTFIILSVFDSFSQIAGQLFGRHKIASKTSPNKTLEGLVGGIVMSLVTSFLIRDLVGFGIRTVLLLTAGVIVWAFLGDLAASFYKRRYNVKDFSRLIPGHGGILDRFDSLIACGAWMFFVACLINVT